MAYFQRCEGWPPTLREIAQRFAIPASTAAYHVRKLKECGLVDREKRAARWIEMTDKGREMLAPDMERWGRIVPND